MDFQFDRGKDGNFGHWSNSSQMKMFAWAETWLCLLSVEMDCIHSREEDVYIQSAICWPLNTENQCIENLNLNCMSLCL